MLVRTVLIIGATGGIGCALANHYAAPGMRLILHGRDQSKLAALSLQCATKGAEVQTKALDLSDTDHLRLWLQHLEIDLAILNAGITNPQTEKGEQWEDIENVLRVNLIAVLAGISSLLPAMQRQGWGQIAIISSLSAYYGMPLTPTYAASKAALKNYAESMRSWLSHQGIAINVVLPGFVKTAMSDHFPGPKPFMMSADQAARIICRGLEANRPRIAFPWHMDLGMRCLAIFPVALSEWILRRLGYAQP